MLIFWVVTPCGLVGTDVSEEHTDLFFSPEDTVTTNTHGVVTQYTNIDFLTAVRTTNLLNTHTYSVDEFLQFKKDS
jgi:hypothetical protein